MAIWQFQHLAMFQHALKIQISVKLLEEFHPKCYFQHMMKSNSSMELLEDAETTVTDLLERIPTLRIESIEHSWSDSDIGVDLLIEVGGNSVYDQVTHVGVECKTNGQPNNIKKALEHLREWSDARNRKVPLLVAPYLPPESRRLAREADCNYVDLVGNACIQFDQVYIERESATIPKQFSRELRSIFMPKSALILRALLGQVGRKWKLTELVDETSVSLGQVSNVLKALEQRNWMERKSGSNVLTEPDALIDEWTSVYTGLQGVSRQYYSVFKGGKLDSMVRDVLHYDQGGARNVVLCSYSAANWISPYARQSDLHLLVQPAVVKELVSHLGIKRVPTGGNVHITLSDDHGAFYGSFEPAPGMVTTSPLQTYLDLLTSGERAREAAQHLRKTTELWQRVN